MTIRLRRSELSTPASSEKMMSKAAACDADLVFLDLEDAVAPSEKEGARTMAVEALNSLDWKPQTVAVRVNDAESHWAYEDVITVVEGAGHKIDLLILPKVKAPRDVWFFDTLLEQMEKKLGLQKKIGLEIIRRNMDNLVRRQRHPRPTLLLAHPRRLLALGTRPELEPPHGLFEVRRRFPA